MSVLLMTSVTLTSGEARFATILLTMSRSVIIPTGNALITTIKQPRPFCDMSSAASNTLLLVSIVTTSLVMISLTVGIEHPVKRRKPLAIKGLLWTCSSLVTQQKTDSEDPEAWHSVNQENLTRLVGLVKKP
jgi:hypothetical protein